MLRFLIVRSKLLQKSMKQNICGIRMRKFAFGLKFTRSTPQVLEKMCFQKNVYYLPTIIPKRNYANYPPHHKITLPALSPTMEKGNLVSWAKKEGDQCKEGDLLAEIETDKATMAFEVTEEGYLAKILVPAGTKDISVGKVVCIICEKQEDVAKFKDYSDSGAAAPPSAPAPAPVPALGPAVSLSAPSAPSAPPTPASSGGGGGGSFPPHHKITLPALSPTMEKGNLVSWAKKEGDQCREGDLLAEIETDKATMAFEVTEEGYLAKILIPAGTKDISVGKVVCIICEKQEDVAKFKDYSDSGAAAPSSAPARAPAPAVPALGPAVSVSAPPTPGPSGGGGGGSFPPHQQITLPALSPTMEKGNLVSWGKKEGDQCKEGDLLAEIETDKATMAFEVSEEGYLAKILVPAGTKDIPVGKVVCILCEKKEDVPKFANYTAGAAAPAAAAKSVTTSAPAATTTAAPAASTSGSRQSPMAKKLAEVQSQRKGGVAPAAPKAAAPAKAAGPSKAKAAAGPSKAKAAAGPPKAKAAKGSSVDIPVSGMRQTIAKRLIESKTQIPHYYLSVDVCADNLLQTRAKMNEKLKKAKIRLSVNDFIIKAMAMASLRIPQVNSYWMGTVIRQFKSVDVSVAVATPTGLITPIVFNADQLTVQEISAEVKRLAAKARSNKLTPQEFQGGTITVSNLGMFDMTSMCSIINPPQAGILAVGATMKRLVTDSKSKLGFKESEFITLTFSGDHRVVDGAIGAEWLKEVKLSIEEPGTMVA